jgi:LemA protein
MGITEFIAGGAVVIVFSYVILIYNGLIRLKNNVERAFANIEVLLKQRHTELPQLVEVCKGYMKHERNLLLAITNARSHVQDAREERDISGLGRAETEMRQSLQDLFVKVEAYPELKANENFLALQERISVLEDTIADRREIYNESVRLNNTRIQQFPDVLVARPFNFVELEYLRFKESDLQPVSIGGVYD